MGVQNVAKFISISAIEHEYKSFILYELEQNILLIKTYILIIYSINTITTFVDNIICKI